MEWTNAMMHRLKAHGPLGTLDFLAHQAVKRHWPVQTVGRALSMVIAEIENMGTLVVNDATRWEPKKEAGRSPFTAREVFSEQESIQGRAVIGKRPMVGEQAPAGDGIGQVVDLLQKQMRQLSQLGDRVALLENDGLDSNLAGGEEDFDLEPRLDDDEDTTAPKPETVGDKKNNKSKVTGKQKGKKSR
jgi:hypothetical protein